MGKEGGDERDYGDERRDGVAELKEPLRSVAVGQDAEHRSGGCEQQHHERKVPKDFYEGEHTAGHDAAGRQWQEDRQKAAHRACTRHASRVLEFTRDLLHSGPSGLHRERQRIGSPGDDEERERAVERRKRADRRAEECDIGRALVAAELTLAGIPALKVPDNWPGYDVIAQPIGREPQRISVKARTFKKGSGIFVDYRETDVFDWLAICILPALGDDSLRAIYIVPRLLADETARRDSPTSKTAWQRYWRVDEVDRVFARFKNNFTLRQDPAIGASL